MIDCTATDFQVWLKGLTQPLDLAMAGSDGAGVIREPGHQEGTHHNQLHRNSISGLGKRPDAAP